MAPPTNNLSTAGASSSYSMAANPKEFMSPPINNPTLLTNRSPAYNQSPLSSSMYYQPQSELPVYRRPHHNPYTPPPMYNPPQFYPRFDDMYSGYPPYHPHLFPPPHTVPPATAQFQTSKPIHHNCNPFLAVIRAGNISKCALCSKTFSREQQVVVIKHVEKDLYVKDGETRVSSEKPRYYHAVLKCVLFRHPYFTYSLLQMESEDFFESLTPDNKELLNALQPM